MAPSPPVEMTLANWGRRGSAHGNVGEIGTTSLCKLARNCHTCGGCKFCSGGYAEMTRSNKKWPHGALLWPSGVVNFPPLNVFGFERFPVQIKNLIISIFSLYSMCPACQWSSQKSKVYLFSFFSAVHSSKESACHNNHSTFSRNEWRHPKSISWLRPLWLLCYSPPVKYMLVRTKQ